MGLPQLLSLALLPLRLRLKVGDIICRLDRVGPFRRIPRIWVEVGTQGRDLQISARRRVGEQACLVGVWKREKLGVMRKVRSEIKGVSRNGMRDHRGLRGISDEACIDQHVLRFVTLCICIHIDHPLDENRSKEGLHDTLSNWPFAPVLTHTFGSCQLVVVVIGLIQPTNEALDG